MVTIVVMSVIVIRRVRDNGSAILLYRSLSLGICAAYGSERHNKDKARNKFVH